MKSNFFTPEVSSPLILKWDGVSNVSPSIMFSNDSFKPFKSILILKNLEDFWEISWVYTLALLPNLPSPSSFAKWSTSEPEPADGSYTS